MWALPTVPLFAGKSRFFTRNVPLKTFSYVARRLYLPESVVDRLWKSYQGAVAGIRRKGLSDGLTVTRWRNEIFRVAGATN